MARPVSSQPTEVELAILKILWSRKQATAREIHNELSIDRETNYSTTVKMLSVMLEKGIVSRDDSCRPQLFRAAKTQTSTQGRMLKHLIDKAYDGSSASLVMQALSSKRASKEELAQIREILDQIEGDKS